MSRPERFSDSSTTREAASSIDVARPPGRSISRTSPPFHCLTISVFYLEWIASHVAP